MKCDPAYSDRINSFALVSYIPGRLGEFFDRLRQELVSGCTAQSHVTILPPRPIQVGIPEAEAELRNRIPAFAPFVIDIPAIRVFERTSVVYADIGRGRENLLEMHDALNVNGLAQDEAYEYHPHITLAQNFAPEELPDVYQTAVRRWEESGLPRRFPVDTLTFVQNTANNLWIDLSECELRGMAEPQLR